MKWYFTFNERVTGWLGDMIKAAVVSAKHYTDLEPHCIYDGRDNPLTDWLTAQGVTLHRRKVWFADELTSEAVIAQNGVNGFDPPAAAGFYLVLEVPRVETEDEFVLFTDCDVIFNGPVALHEIRPKFLAAVPEVPDLMASLPADVAGTAFNSGVILMNVPAMRNMSSTILDLLRQHGFYRVPGRGATYDQAILNEAYQGRWEHLPDRYNWRAFWVENDDARIIHFHGPKPQQIRAFLEKSNERKGGQIEQMISTHLEQYRPNLNRVACLLKSLHQSG
jgi:hypothetical protein